MEIPKIIYNDKILRRVSPFMRIRGITLWPWIILKKRYRDQGYFLSLAPILIRHETIHIKQQQELLVVPFYLLYVLEFILKFLVVWSFIRAYKSLSFEIEANKFERDENYLDNRKFWAWVKYIFRLAPKN